MHTHLPTTYIRDDEVYIRWWILLNMTYGAVLSVDDGYRINGACCLKIIF